MTWWDFKEHDFALPKTHNMNTIPIRSNSDVN